MHGAPIIVDDLTNTRFSQHAIETIKNDDFGIAEHLVNYPAVVISANEDVKAVAPEVIRRTVICRVQAGLTNTEVMSSNIVRTVQREVGTALYREYLRQMLEIVPELLELMKKRVLKWLMHADKLCIRVLITKSRCLRLGFTLYVPVLMSAK